MLLLSPPKVAVILLVALVVLGPDKLPATAKRIGALWGDLRRWRLRLEDELRTTFPDLPSTSAMAHAVRSPMGFLDRLADEHARTAPRSAPGPADGPGRGGSGPDPTPGAGGGRSGDEAGSVGTGGALDPSCN